MSDQLSQDDLRLLDALLDEALDLEPDKISAFVEARCPAELRPKLEQLLASLAPDSPTAGLATGGGLGAILRYGDDDDGSSGPSGSGELAPGSLIGPYRVVGKLGRGGMGHVYHAERDDGQFDQRVALKLADVARGDAAQVKRRFALERQILAGLDHPNIARLLDGGVTDEGRPWFAMEVVEGERLDRYCDRERLDLRHRLELFVKVARAVASAHRKLVVHRDLKPSNLLVTSDGTVKLLDFGIAKLLDDDVYGLSASGITRTHQMVLTPEYAAPEQFLGEPVTTATDVYQLGILLYELLTGRRPFDSGGLSHVEMQVKVCTEAPMRPSTVVAQAARQGVEALTETLARLSRRGLTPRRLRRKLEGDLDTVVMKALRREPERRYLSADDVADDIERFLSGHPIQARPDSLGYRARKFARRHVGAVATTAAALLVIASLVFFYTVQLKAERDTARREAVRANLVSEFLTEVFDGADPFVNRGEEATARQLLEEGARRLETLDAEPEVHADLSHLIGRIHGRLGDFEAARTLLDEALVERAEIYGEDSPKTADTLYELALLDEHAGDYERGLERALRVLAVRQDADESTWKRAQVWNRIAYLQRHLLSYEESWASGQRALGLLTPESDDGAEPPGGEPLGGPRRDEDPGLFDDESLRLEVLFGLGYVAQRLGEQSAALDLFVTARRLAESWDEERRKHPNVARVYRSLGGLYGRLGEREEARAAHEEALVIYEEVLPEDHPELAGLLINMGEGHNLDDEPERAVPVLERALVICRGHLGEDHLHTALALLNLSNARSQLEEHSEAMTLHGRALGILGRTVGEDHPMYVHAFGFGGELLRRSGDAAGALERQNQALARGEVVFGPDHPELAQILEEKARALEDLGRFREAAAAVRRELAVRAPHVPGDSEVPARLTKRAEELEARSRPDI